MNKQKRIMNRVVTLLSISIVSLAITACVASRPEEIKGKEVSTDAFQSYSCDQLAEFYRSKKQMSVSMEAELRRRAETNDDLTAVWAVTGLQTGGYKYNDGPLADEYAEIKGNMAAIQVVMIEKDCPDLPW